MNTIKIALLMKRKFSEFYDIRHYKKQLPEQLIVRRYSVNDRKITINEEK